MKLLRTVEDIFMLAPKPRLISFLDEQTRSSACNVCGSIGRLQMLSISAKRADQHIVQSGIICCPVFGFSEFDG